MELNQMQRLIDTLTQAENLRTSSKIGDEAGQFPKKAADALESEVKAASAAARVKDQESALYEEAADRLEKAIQAFVKAEKKEGPKKTSLQGVVLKGWEEGQQGTDTLFIGGKIVNFRDGQAEVPKDQADELRKAGYIE